MLGTSLAGGLGYSIVNFPFQIVPTALLWWAVLASAWAADQGRIGPAGTPSAGCSGRCGVILLACSGL